MHPFTFFDILFRENQGYKKCVDNFIGDVGLNAIKWKTLNLLDVRFKTLNFLS